MTVVVVRAFVTDRLVVADLDVYVALPPKEAVTVKLPAGAAVDGHAALWEVGVTVAVHTVVVPTSKVTVPVGAEPAPVTVALYWTFSPKVVEVGVTDTVTVGSGLSTVMERLAVAVPDVEAPLTLTVNVTFPAVAGVPEITPVELVSVNPNGRALPVSDQV